MFIVQATGPVACTINVWDRNLRFSLQRTLQLKFLIIANLARIVNYDRKTFIVQANGFQL